MYVFDMSIAVVHYDIIYFFIINFHIFIQQFDLFISLISMEAYDKKLLVLSIIDLRPTSTGKLRSRPLADFAIGTLP